jgi:glycosyltransferase involved in cell wall biosynthesis
VLLAGWHEQFELPELLAAADLLVLPSEREAFGQVIVEAMGCGLPVIAAASPGPRHIVADGETGWLVPVGDRDALTAALVAAVNDRDERARRARRAERVAHERFTRPAIAAPLEALLRGVAR